MHVFIMPATLHQRMVRPASWPAAWQVLSCGWRAVSPGAAWRSAGVLRARPGGAGPGFVPVASGGTPMSGALTRAQSVVSGWLNEHPACFPPVVLNLTDGEANDGDPTAPAEALRQLASADGPILVFNLHVSSDSSQPISFPDSDAALPNQYAQLLFNMSSTLPEHMRTYAQQQGIAVSEATRGFVFNADITSIVQFLDIGTRASDLR